MGVNLLAAHGLRFKVQASGTRLAGRPGRDRTGCRADLAGGRRGLGQGHDRRRRAVRVVGPVDRAQGGAWSRCGLAARGCSGKLEPAASSSAGRWSFAEAVLARADCSGCSSQGDAATLGDSSMRILWQLIKGGLAGLVLLAGCVLVFRKRAGIVLLHAGVALMMANELVVHTLHVEGQMHIREGETVNYRAGHSHGRTGRGRSLERQDRRRGRSCRGRCSKTASRFDDETLPFDVEVDRVPAELGHSTTPKPGEKNLATPAPDCNGRRASAPRAPAPTPAARSTLAAAYVKLLDKRSRPAARHLPGQRRAAAAEGEVGDKTYDLALRFKRTYKPYSMQLDDVRFDKYLGTQTAEELFVGHAAGRQRAATSTATSKSG